MKYSKVISETGATDSMNSDLTALLKA